MTDRCLPHRNQFFVHFFLQFDFVAYRVSGDLMSELQDLISAIAPSQICRTNIYRFPEFTELCIFDIQEDNHKIVRVIHAPFSIKTSDEEVPLFRSHRVHTPYFSCNPVRWGL
jgi:hypothetical protein